MKKCQISNVKFPINTNKTQIIIGKYKLHIANWKFSPGFTLIELLIVIGVIGVVAGMGFVSLRDFSDRQVLVASAKNMTAVLQLARSRAQTQVKPASCVDNPLTGYRFTFVCTASGCTGYTLHPACGSVITQAVASGTFPSDVTVTTDADSLIFETLSGLVRRPDGSTAPTVIQLQGKTQTETIEVYHDGRIVRSGGV